MKFGRLSKLLIRSVTKSLTLVNTVVPIRVTRLITIARMSSTQISDTRPRLSGVFLVMKFTGFCSIMATKKASMNGNSGQNAKRRNR